MSGTLRRLWYCGVVVTLAAVTASAYAARYQALAFEANTEAHAINRSGIIVGETTANGPPEAVVWTIGGTADNPLLSAAVKIGPLASSALDIADNVIVGWQEDGSGNKTAVYWEIIGDVYSGPNTLPALADHPQSWATGVNENGLIVGIFQHTDGNEHAGYWEKVVSENPDGSTQEKREARLFPEPQPTQYSAVHGVDAGTYAAGFADDGTANLTALLWTTAPAEDEDPMVVLATPNGYDARAEDINTARIAGWYDSADDPSNRIPRALSWERVFKNQYLELGTLDGDRSKALASNAVGETVGWAGTSTSRKAFLFAFGCGQQDLNDLLVPASAQNWVLSEGRLISNKSSGNWIIGSGQQSGSAANFLLTPTALEVDLAVSMAADHEHIYVGEPHTYTISVTNKTVPTADNDGYATCVQVQDELPEGLSYLSATTSKGVCLYRNPTVRCIINRLDSGETAEIVLETEARPVLADRIAKNVVTVSSTETELAGKDGDNSMELSTAVERSGCFIATAAYGSYLDPHVQALRDFRDRFLLTNAPGAGLVEFYYRHSPPLATFIQEHTRWRLAVRAMLTPLVYAVEFPAVAIAVLLALVTVWRVRRTTKRAAREETL